MNLRPYGARLVSILSQPNRYLVTERIFLRLLGLVYLAAFGSLWSQIEGLLGSHGILPVVRALSVMRTDVGSRAFLYAPTLFWFDSSDTALTATCMIGCAFSLVLIAGRLLRVSAAVCWILYLSLVSVGEPFTNFQWDALLLESGFLALFAGAPWLVWAYRFLLFRLMFESGLVKLLSGDPNWRNLHALRYHFLTQPLPTPLAYYAYRSPAWLLDSLTAFTLFIELVVPWLLFAPRRFRQVAVALLITLQICILLTGNYAFFNLLAVALCFWGLDDRTFAPLAPWLRVPSHTSTTWLSRSANVALALLIAIGAVQLLRMPSPYSLRWTRPVLAYIAPFEIVNTYGLFAVMTTTRPEIIIEGSNDQVDWREYNFRYKPGELHRDLPLVAPHQPRLDWQMWFAALGTPGENGWINGLMYRLLLGDRTVIGLMQPSPFDKPPHYMRAQLYDYKFTTPAERARTGAIWTRELRGTWYGPVSITGR
ncbi:MAG: lipase maturation factor family protein [Acidobacteriaceae bacterium]|nr:lipase maturation factor family protein [Acidobacteriaceae bacterium]